MNMFLNHTSAESICAVSYRKTATTSFWKTLLCKIFIWFCEQNMARQLGIHLRSHLIQKEPRWLYHHPLTQRGSHSNTSAHDWFWVGTDDISIGKIRLEQSHGAERIQRKIAQLKTSAANSELSLRRQVDVAEPNPCPGSPAMYVFLNLWNVDTCLSLLKVCEDDQGHFNNYASFEWFTNCFL